MKQIWEEIGLALILGLVLPGILLQSAVWFSQRGAVPEDRQDETEVREPEHERTEIKVLMEDGCVAVMDLEDYITGVVLAEMPASFRRRTASA